jgi:signal peptidase I
MKLQKIRQFIVTHIFADILALILILFLILRIFAVDYTFVPSESMSNTIKTGDFVIFRKFSTSFLMGLPIIGKYLYKPNDYNYHKSMNTLNKINRGDVILWTDGTNNYVKRVLALPGDIVQFNEFDVVVNGVSTMFQDPTEQTLFAEPEIVRMKHDDGVDEDVVKMRSQVMINDDTAAVFDVYFSYKLPGMQGQDDLMENDYLIDNGLTRAAESNATNPKNRENAKNQGHSTNYYSTNYLMARQNASYRVMCVPSNVVFIRGDNRDHSYDSACDGLFVKLDSIIGKASYAVLGTKIRFGRYDANASWLNTAPRIPFMVMQYAINISPRCSNLQPVHKHVSQVNRVSAYYDLYKNFDIHNNKSFDAHDNCNKDLNMSNTDINHNDQATYNNSIDLSNITSSVDDAKPALPIINSELITKSELIEDNNADGTHHLMDYLNNDDQKTQQDKIDI